MTDFRAIPGSSAFLEWFGRPPRFHDANLLEISLANSGSSQIRIHTWQITEKIDAQGYLVLDKHVVVTFSLAEITEVKLDEFHLPGIIGFLEIARDEDGFKFTWDSSYGVWGLLKAKQASVEFRPGKP